MPILTKIITMRFEPEIVAAIDTYADERGMTRSQFFRLLVEQYKK